MENKELNESNNIKETNCTKNIQTLEDPCTAKVESTTIPLCDGSNITPKSIQGPVVAKIPVVLAEKDIQVDIGAKIQLEQKTNKITNVSKEVYLTKCDLVPLAQVNQCGVPISGKLFLTGYVRETINYQSLDCSSETVSGGSLDFTTLDVPFSCVTEVKYMTPPIVPMRGAQTVTQSYYSEANLFEGCTCSETTTEGPCTCEQYSEDRISYVSKPYCELLGARITEMDKSENFSFVDGVRLFSGFDEKMVVYLRVKVLQKQQVSIK